MITMAETSTEVTTTRLPNGLTIWLKEIHTAPIISHWVWYRVGSRNETVGKRGVSHWVEHMQFKGTPKFPAHVLDKAISRTGGHWNAFTYLDWTAYFETMPADQIDLALELEADRMDKSVFEPQEVEAERNVVISEKEGNDNEPLARLGTAIQKAAFDCHPYRYEVIGELEDLQTMSREDLYHHYRAYYVPNNALIAVAGDFKTNDMIARLEKLYAGLQPGIIPAFPEYDERRLSGERRVEVTGPGETTYLQVVYRTPRAAEDHFFALSVADSILAGPTSLNMFGGGGISNKTSRLYRALVETELAVAVYGGVQATIDPFLYQITVTLRPQRSPAEALAKLDDEIKRLMDAYVPDSEVQRSIKQAKALFSYGSESIANQAFWLGYAEMFANYEWFQKYLERLEMVTREDVLAVARSYLDPSNRVVGVYIPDGNMG